MHKVVLSQPSARIGRNVVQGKVPCVKLRLDASTLSVTLKQCFDHGAKDMSLVKNIIFNQWY